MNTSDNLKEWVLKLAEREDSRIISTGGLVSGLKGGYGEASGQERRPASQLNLSEAPAEYRHRLRE